MIDVPPPDDSQAPPPDDAPPDDHAGRLAFKAPCRFCKREVFVARCDDRKWRTFELPDYPPTEEGIWVWHNRHGMQEYARFGRPPRPGEELVPGKRLHYCAEYSLARMRLDVKDLPPG